MEKIVSNKVYIRRKPSMAAYPGFDKVDNIKKIGSSLKDQDALRGLNPDEEIKFLSRIIGVSATSEKWEKAARDYWSNISVKVPNDEKGLELEVGFIYKNEEDKEAGEKLSIERRHEKGNPIKVADYILYRYCLVYGRVANSIDEVDKSPKIWFYIYTKEKELKSQMDKIQKEDAALQAYFKILGNRDKVDDVLTVLSYEAPDVIPLNIHSMDNREKDVLLRASATKVPERFVSICENKDLGMRSFIEKCINEGKLRRVPNTDTIIYGDNQTIGDSIADTIAFLKNESNAKIYNNLAAQLKFMVKQDVVKETKESKEK